MNKKIGIIVGSIIGILSIFFLIIILLNQNTSKDISKNIEQENVENQSNVEENNVEVVEEKTNEIVLNSKIGMEIQDLIYIPNIYSDAFFREIEASGLNDRAIIMFTFSRIMSDDEYITLRRQSPDYVGEYVTEDDLQNLTNKLFVNSSSLKHQEVFLPNSYDEQNGNYIKLPTGFVEFSYIKDIPYKIEEKGNDLTVYSYRMYINCNIPDNLEENGNSIQTIYYDSQKKNEAIIINDEKMDDENTQTEFLIQKINDGSINKENLKQGVYNITRKGNSYVINNIR